MDNTVMSDGLVPGTIFEGKYLIEREVGRGSFGAVYLAREEGRNEAIAVKVLLPWVKTDTEMRHRFKREAQLASHLTGPHGIKIHEFGETADGSMFLVMEYLMGLPLSTMLSEQGPMAPRRVQNIARQTLLSLAEAHGAGIIHRDLKPPNIFICNDEARRDFVKVFDYGIAKIVGGDKPGGLRETTKLTVRGGLVGTPVYMSPEQCRGEDLTPASDLYSLGVVMYEMLTGDVPFDHANPVQVMIMHNQAPVPELPAHLQNSTVARCVKRALSKEPHERFKNADEFIAALDETDEQSAARSQRVSGTAETIAAGPASGPQFMRESAYRETVSLQIPQELQAKKVPQEVVDKIPADLLAKQQAAPAPAASMNYVLVGVIALLVVVVVILAAMQALK